MVHKIKCTDSIKAVAELTLIQQLHGFQCLSMKLGHLEKVGYAGWTAVTFARHPCFIETPQLVLHYTVECGSLLQKNRTAA